jgi:hypothetical protein
MNRLPKCLCEWCLTYQLTEFGLDAQNRVPDAAGVALLSEGFSLLCNGCGAYFKQQGNFIDLDSPEGAAMLAASEVHNS